MLIEFYSSRWHAREGGRLLPETEYRDETGWLPLPEWAQYAWHTGERIAEQTRTGTHVLCALSVPCRDFVAALGAAAYLSVRSARDQLAAPNLIAPGSDILVLHGMKGRIARVLEHGFTSIERNGRVQEHPGLWVQLEDGSREMIGYRHDLKLARAPRPFDVSKRRLASVKMPKLTALSTVLLHGEPHTYASSTSVDCLLLGPVPALRSEISDQDFRVSGTRIEGHLSEIIRAREVLEGNVPWHARILSDHATRISPELHAPGIVIFDGVLGFRKWRHLFKSSDWLVVLDRGRPDYAEGVALVEEEHARRGGDLPIPTENPPSGMELSSFQRAR